MGNATLERLRSEVLALPEPKRAELAHELVKNPDAPDDSDAADAWDSEILRGLSEIEAGTAVPLACSRFTSVMIGAARVSSDAGA